MPDRAANATWKICDDLNIAVDRVPSCRESNNKQSISHDEKQLNQLLNNLGIANGLSLARSCKAARLKLTPSRLNSVVYFLRSFAI